MRSLPNWIANRPLLSLSYMRQFGSNQKQLPKRRCGMTTTSGKCEEAIAAFEKACELGSARIESPTEANAELAMLLINCPDHRYRDPRRAAELAEQLVQKDPNWSKQWTVLGVVR